MQLRNKTIMPENNIGNEDTALAAAARADDIHLYKLYEIFSVVP